MLIFLEWFGTGTGIIGAILVASNTAGSPWGFVFFLVSSVCWSGAAYLLRKHSLLVLQVVFTLINLVGIYRWLLV